MDTFVVKFLCLLSTIPCMRALTVDECQKATDMCQQSFLSSTQVEMSAICGQARTALTCVFNLECRSEMFLRIAYRTIQNRLDTLNTQCELGVIFPSSESSSEDCRNQVDTCTYTYIDNLSRHQTTPANETMLCDDLNSFVDCIMGSQTCGSNLDKLRETVDDEKLRLKVSECSVSSLNYGSRAVAGLLPIVFAMILSVRMLFM